MSEDTEFLFAKKDIPFVQILVDPNRDGISEIRTYLEQRFQDISNSLAQLEPDHVDYTTLLEAQDIFEASYELFEETTELLKKVR